MHDTLCACAFNSNLCAHRLAYVSAILCCINIIPYIYMYVDLHEDGFASGGDVRSGEGDVRSGDEQVHAVLHGLARKASVVRQKP